MTKDPLKPQLWTPRPVEETLKVYADWADTYDDDVASKGYHTPERMAKALAAHLTGTGPVLDYGCGTGVSGAALGRAGIGPLHGTDISAEMLALAEGKGLYEKLWHSRPGASPAEPGTYRAIAAVGVVSLGAAPPETMDLLIDALGPGGLLAMSFNDPTLEAGSYDAQMNAAIDAGKCDVIFRKHGPHLDDLDMGSDVIILRIT